MEHEELRAEVPGDGERTRLLAVLADQDRHIALLEREVERLAEELEDARRLPDVRSGSEHGVSNVGATAQRDRHPSSVAPVSAAVLGRLTRARAGIARLIHGVIWRLPHGWTNPLLDKDWYRASYPDVRAMNSSAQRHYRRHGAAEGRNPSPFFDTSWYLRRYPDVAASRINPLDHYLRFGARESRDPSREFNSAAYLEANPDVRALGMNPLLHYIRRGKIEGRLGVRSAPVNVSIQKSVTTNAPAASQQPASSGFRNLIASATTPPVVLKVGRWNSQEDPARAGGSFDMLWLTHYSPWPARAGNEYSSQRLLSWLKLSGWKVLILYAPPGRVRRDDPNLGVLMLEHPDTILIDRDGTIVHDLAHSPARSALERLDGRRTRRLARDLGEERDTHLKRVNALIREFCPDALVEVLLALDADIGPTMVFANYVFMTRAFMALRPDSLKILDTHDLFSAKQTKVVALGVADNLALSLDEEATLLHRADIVVAIHKDDAKDIRAMAPGVEVVTRGVDYDVVRSNVEPDAATVLFVASGNHLNVVGLREFLRFVWPRVLARSPTATFRVVGDVGDILTGAEPGVERVGRVADLGSEYARATVVINPVRAGTGLKIKTLEALAHLRPIVLWPAGGDGLSAELLELCHVATSWYAFGEQVIRLMGPDRVLVEADGPVVGTVSRELSAAKAFGELTNALPRPRVQ